MRAGWRRGVAVVAVGLGVATTAAILLDAVGVVTTRGASMEPVYEHGDVVVVAPADSYAVGQIVAYRDAVHDLVVLHRIVGGDAAGYELKGDNNASVDAVRPTSADMIGRVVLHVPRLGAWLRRLAGPVPLAVAVAALIAAGGATSTRRRRRRHSVSRRRGPLSPRLRVVACATAAVGVAGVALGGLTWTRPVRAPALVAEQLARSMTFSYSATVARTAAYDGTTVRSPDVVFRTLANVVDVRFAYVGRPGTLRVDAELATAGGWHSTAPLAGPVTVPTGRHDGAVRLDLAAFDRRARAAAAITGLAAERITVTVTPRVTSTDGTSFAPALRLTLTPLQLAIADAPSALTVRDTTTAWQTRDVPQKLHVLKWQLPVSRGRPIAAALVLLVLIAGLVLVVIARRSGPAEESTAIRRRYGPLLLPVHPMPTAPGHRVVDVTTFAALAKLAERYGLLVLHWSRSDVETFVVQDEGTTYRYRAGAGEPLVSGPPHPLAAAAGPEVLAGDGL